MKKEVKSELLESLVETYNTFVEFVECPSRSGYMAVLGKLRPESKELIKSKLLDSWGRVDRDLYKVIRRMRKVMGYDEDIPGGIKE